MPNYNNHRHLAHAQTVLTYHMAHGHTESVEPVTSCKWNGAPLTGPIRAPPVREAAAVELVCAGHSTYAPRPNGVEDQINSDRCVRYVSGLTIRDLALYTILRSFPLRNLREFEIRAQRALFSIKTPTRLLRPARRRRSGGGSGRSCLRASVARSA